MGTTCSLVSYAERVNEADKWALKNEVVEGPVSSWLIQQVEKMQGRGQFVFLSQIEIEVKENRIDTFRRYVEQIGFLDVYIPKQQEGE